MIIRNCDHCNISNGTGLSFKNAVQTVRDAHRKHLVACTFSSQPEDQSHTELKLIATVFKSSIVTVKLFSLL